MKAARDVAVFVVFLLLLCVDGWGCGVAQSGSENWCEGHRCNYVDLAFDPGPELLDETQAAMKNINNATELGLDLDGQGIVVRAVPRAYGADGDWVCGITEIARDKDSSETLSIEIQIGLDNPDGCMPVWAIIRHEIACHALGEGGLAHPSTLDGGHARDGVCSPTGNDLTGLDDAALDILCAGAPGGCRAHASR